MRKLIWAILTATALAQGGGVVVGNFGVQYVTSAPAGTCSQNAAMRVVLGLGTVYTCQSNTWAQVGAGGAVTPGAPDTSVQFNNGGAFAGSSLFTFNQANALLYFGDDSSLAPPELPLNGQFNVFIKDRDASPNNARYGLQVLNYNTIDGSATGANFAAVVSATNAGAVGSDHYAFSVGSNNVAQLWSEYVFGHHASTGTADEMVGVYIDAFDKAGGAGVVTSAKGIHIEPQTVAATNVAIDIGNMGSGTALNVVGGVNNLGAGTTTVGNLIDSGASASSGLCTNGSKQLISCSTLAIYSTTRTAQVAGITDTTMVTPGSAGLYRFTGTINCTTTSAAATATLNLKYTDTGSAAQTVSITDTCTALVTSGIPNLVTALRAKASTNITWGVTIANTPTYDVDVRLEQM